MELALTTINSLFITDVALKWLEAQYEFASRLSFAASFQTRLSDLTPKAADGLGTVLHTKHEGEQLTEPAQSVRHT